MDIGEEQKKVFASSSDDLFSTENIGEEQKKVFTSSDDLFSTENIGEEQKRGSSRPRMSCVFFCNCRQAA